MTTAPKANPDPLRVVAVVGPTAAGKAAVGREVAQRFEVPVLVCDSVKVYRGLDIGSAKPSAAVRARIPHHGLDLADPDEAFSAGDYARAMAPHLLGLRALLVGGTGFYLRATCWTQSGPDVDAGRDDPERHAHEARLEALEHRDRGAVHRALTAVDPVTAATIHPNNVHRAIRALWLCARHGAPVSQVRVTDPPRRRWPLLLVIVDPGPEALARAIDARLSRMLEAGFLAEVEKLRQAGYDGRYKAMRSLGYRQLLDVAEGKTSLAEARESIVVSTRQYAKRQRTYFRTQVPADEVVTVADQSQIPFSTIAAFWSGGSR